MRTDLSSREPSGLRRRAIALRIALISAIVIPSAAQAQSYTWGGGGSTTATTDYNTGTNWSNQAAVPPPVAAGQAAVFDSTGSATVAVTSGPISPDSWTFNANSKSFLISGADVNFSVAGAGGGIIDKANSGQSIEIFNNINGPGVQVQVLGNSALTLFGTNTYAGGTTVSGFGTLSVVSNTAAGTGVVTLENGQFQAAAPNLVIANHFVINPTAAGSAITTAGFSAAFTGDISGAGKLTITSFGFGGPFTPRVILDGINTYTGGTTICSCAAVQLGDATHLASLVGEVTVFGTFDIVNANTAGITKITNDFEPGAFFAGLTTFRNAASAGTMTIINKHGGETDFFNNSTAANSTIINEVFSFTTFNNFASASSAKITNFFGEIDFFDRSTAADSIIVNWAGLTTFNGHSTAGSANIANLPGGLVIFNDNSTAGNANIANDFLGQIFFTGHSTAGNATITNSSFGAFIGPIPVGLFFADQSSAGNATIINNDQGAIAFGSPFGLDTATAGNANITNNAGSTLQFNAFTTADNATITTNSGAKVGFFDASTGGNAQFITNGTGYVDFTGTVGPNFDGRITAGSIAGSGTYYIGGFNTLVVGGNNLSTEVSGVIGDSGPCGCPGPGSLEKVGAGQLTLSGINTYTGTTVVNGGFLNVMGSIVSSSGVAVNSGGALTGSGIVSDTTIASGGIFLPGSGFGTSMSVQGNLAFQSGALYLVQLNSTTSTFADVTGTAQLSGNVGVAIDPAGIVMKKYMILQAAKGVSGTFDGLAAPLPGGLVAALSYDPNHAYLNFDLNFGAKNNLNVNQTNVASTLTNFFNANGGIPAVFALLSPAGLTQASGELATGTQQATFNAMNLFMSLLTDLSVSGRGSNVTAGSGAQPYAEEESSLAYAAKTSGGARDALARMPAKAVARNDLLDSRWSLWGSAFGGGADISGNAALGSNNANVRAFGFAAGADYRISPATLAGFALAGGGTNFSVTGSGYGRSDMFQAGAFVRHTVGAAYISGALAYGGQEVTTDRFVAIAGIDHLRAQFNSNAWSGRIEGGYRYATPWMGITPYAAAQFTTLSLPAYAEQVIAGTGMFALNYNARNVTDPRSELGVRTDRSFATSNGILTLRGRLAWAHDYDIDRNISPVFQSLPGAFFVVNGAAQAHDSALTTASAEMRWLNGWSAAATFEGEFSNVMNSYAGKGVVRYAW